MFIDFLHRFVIDHINCYYFRLMTYSIGENQSFGAKGYIRQSQPLVGQDEAQPDQSLLSICKKPLVFTCLVHSMHPSCAYSKSFVIGGPNLTQVVFYTL